jgi:Domain of unknown function (DUF4157)
MGISRRMGLQSSPTATLRQSAPTAAQARAKTTRAEVTSEGYDERIRGALVEHALGAVQAKPAIDAGYSDLIAAARAPVPRASDATGMPALARAKMEGALRMEAPTAASAGSRAAHLARFADAVGLIQRRGRGEPALARVAAAPGPATVPSGFAAAVANSRGGGSPLPSSVRGFMEAHPGADFSSVQGHTGETAARLTSQVSEQAFRDMRTDEPLPVGSAPAVIPTQVHGMRRGRKENNPNQTKCQQAGRQIRARGRPPR